jgi:hypothetical protein
MLRDHNCVLDDVKAGMMSNPQSSPDTRTGRTFAPNAHVEREQSLRHPPCPGGGGLCVPRHPDIETFYTKCANLSTVYTFTQSRHLHSPTNSASSSCLWTKCNILTHGRYLLSAYKARRPVYTSTQRRENLQSCLLQGWLNSKTPLCLHLRLIRLHYNFCSFKGLNI